MIERLKDWRMPADVAGWLTETEARALAELARGRRVLEIGSYAGRSTIAMAQTALSIDAVDPFDARTVGGPGTLELFRANVARYGLAGKVTAHVGITADVVPALGTSDLIFIDGDHAYDAVMQDTAHALAHLAPAGLLAYHDCRAFPGEHDGRWDPGVTKAIYELRGRGYKHIAQAGTVAVLRPPPNHW